MPAEGTNWLEFDIHGYAFVRVDQAAPSAAIFREVFRPFAAKDLRNFDLTVTKAGDRPTDFAYADERYRYSRDAVQLRSPRVQVALDDTLNFHLSGRGELLNSALPLIDIILARRGAAMIHAAAFEYNQRGIALPAWGGTGKTSTMARLLLGPDEGSFMSDDWSFVAKDGRLLGFAKPMFIKPHHRTVYPKLFNDRHKPMVPSSLSRLMDHVATAVHPTVTRFPRVASFTRRWSPEHMMVLPETVFDRVRLTAPLGAVIFMERYSGPDMTLEPKEAEWMAGRLVGNFYAEMSASSRELLTALGATGLVPLPEPFEEKRRLLTVALGAKPMFLLRIPDSLGTYEASGKIASRIVEALTGAGIAPTR